MNPTATSFTTEEQSLLLALARTAIEAQAAGMPDPAVESASLPPALRELRGCFVTLTRKGELRGCIGNIYPHEPLYRAVMENARGAAFRDTRFAPVAEWELPELEMEISVLTEPERLEFNTPEELLHKLRPNVDGVVVKFDWRSATFLPQVWRKFPDPVRFLDLLAQKAQLPAGAWRDPNTVVLTYQVESFESLGCC